MPRQNFRYILLRENKRHFLGEDLHRLLQNILSVVELDNSHAVTSDIVIVKSVPELRTRRVSCPPFAAATLCPPTCQTRKILWQNCISTVLGPFSFDCWHPNLDLNMNRLDLNNWIECPFL